MWLIRLMNSVLLFEITLVVFAGMPPPPAPRSPTPSSISYRVMEDVQSNQRRAAANKK